MQNEVSILKPEEMANIFGGSAINQNPIVEPDPSHGNADYGLWDCYEDFGIRWDPPAKK